MLTAYMDESYSDGNVMCVGGWLCDEKKWATIESQWQKRIDYENRQSAKRGLPPITRYHATDLNNYRNEFKGWDERRAVLFTKKLIDILGRGKEPIMKPIGIACGVRVPHLVGNFPQDHPTIYKNHFAAYRLCMIENLLVLSRTLATAFPDEKVAVIYDKGPFGGAAQSAFESFQESKVKRYEDVLTMAPVDGKKCIALQCADLFAYEGRKLVTNPKQAEREFRRSLRRVIGNDNYLRVRQITKDVLEKIAANRKSAPEPPHDWDPSSGV